MADKKDPGTGASPSKKKMLPVILAVVVVILGGGYFMMSGNRGGEAEKPKLELGEKVALGEYLVNLNDGQTYLMTEIVVQVAKGQSLTGVAGGKPDATAMAPIQNAVIHLLSGKSVHEISSPEGKAMLRREIAAAINHEVNTFVAPKEEATEEETGETSQEQDAQTQDAQQGSTGQEHPLWDSDTGPVLRVFFTKFATQ